MPSTHKNARDLLRDEYIACYENLEQQKTIIVDPDIDPPTRFQAIELMATGLVRLTFLTAPLLASDLLISSFYMAD